MMRMMRMMMHSGVDDNGDGDQRRPRQVGGGSAPRSTELLPSNGGPAKEWFKLRNPRFGIKMIITIITIVTITVTITATINITTIITIIVTITTLRPIRRLQQTSCFVFQAVPLLCPSKSILDHSQWRHDDDEDEDDSIKWLMNFIEIHLLLKSRPARPRWY